MGDQIKQNKTIKGPRAAFNNKQTPYRIVSYKRSQITNVIQFERENGPVYTKITLLQRQLHAVVKENTRKHV